MRRNIGYIISAALLVLFGILSAALQFSPSNTVWAFFWMAAAIITAWVTTFRNFRTSQTDAEKILYLLLMIPLTCGLFGLLIVPLCLAVSKTEIPLC